MDTTEVRYADHGKAINTSSTFEHPYFHISAHPNKANDAALVALYAGPLSLMVSLQADEARALGAHLVALADRLDRYAIDNQLAAEAADYVDAHRPAYQPTGPIIDGVEITTGRLACCGAGSDRVDPRTGERLHLPGCRLVAGAGLAACRQALGAS